MSFFKKAADSIVSDIQSGDTARIEKAAKDAVYALMEGPGAAGQNLDALTAAAAENRKKNK